MIHTPAPSLGLAAFARAASFGLRRALRQGYKLPPLLTIGVFRCKRFCEISERILDRIRGRAVPPMRRVMARTPNQPLAVYWIPACAGMTSPTPRHSRAGGNPGTRGVGWQRRLVRGGCHSCGAGPPCGYWIPAGCHAFTTPASGKHACSSPRRSMPTRASAREGMAPRWLYFLHVGH